MGADQTKIQLMSVQTLDLTYPVSLLHDGGNGDNRGRTKISR